MAALDSELQISREERNEIVENFKSGKALVINEEPFEVASTLRDAEPDLKATIDDETKKEKEKLEKDDIFDDESEMESPLQNYTNESSDDDIIPQSRKHRNDIFDDESNMPSQSPEPKKDDGFGKCRFGALISSEEEEESTSKSNKVMTETSIKEICSETQRIARKATVSLPYHKPKQRSLLEFLNRKRASTSEGSKPSAKDLPQILKVIEDRSHEAETFFAPDDIEQNTKIPSPAKNADLTADVSSACSNEQTVKASVHETPELSPSVVQKSEVDEMIENQQARRHSLKNALHLANVPDKPKLFGRPGDILNLDDDPVKGTTKNRTGVAGFVELAMQQIALSTKRLSSGHDNRDSISKTNETSQSTESVNKGKEENSVYAIQRQKFKEALQSSISEKRAAARLRKQQESKIDNEEDGQEEEEEEEELDYDELSDCDDEDSLLSKKKSKSRKRREDPKDEDADEVESASLDEGASSCKFTPENLIDQEEENGSLIAATPNLNASSSGSKDESSLKDKLFTSQIDYNASFNEVIGLCSGAFPSTGKVIGEDDEDPNPAEDEDNGDSFSSTLGDVGIAAVDEEANNEENEPKLSLNDDENSQNNEFSTSKSRRKKLLPLLLSDDEDEPNYDEEEDDVQSFKSDDELGADVKAPTDFFDKEAELSGSELGSDDEREDEEDGWEMEEGDKEDIDEDEVREQVGRTHLKTMLDDDQREVRLFQELFLEDGDLHSEGGGRQKQFKWNTSIEGFERAPTQDENNPDDQDACDGADEAAWRKAKNEREKWLQEKGMSVAMDDMKFKAKPVKIVNTKVAPRPETKDNADPNPQLSSPTKSNAMLKVRRGSFLRRGEKELTDIASLTKVLQPVQAPTASSNFVFASVTPKRNATEKRKVKREDAGVEISPRAPPSKKSKVKTASKSVFSFLES